MDVQGGDSAFLDGKWLVTTKRDLKEESDMAERALGAIGDETVPVDRRSGYHLFVKDRELTVSDGTPIAYTVLGPSSPTRPTVVLVNGWSCSDVYWAELAPHLEERGHRVVLIDHRGHGASGLPRKPGYRARNITKEDMALERVAADVVEVCEHESIERAVLIGHSMGVQVALEAYAQGRDRVQALVAVAGPYENPLRTFYGQSYSDRLFPVGKFALHAIPRFILPAWRLMGAQHTFGHRVALLVRAAGPKLTARALAPYIEHLVTRDPLVMFKLVESMRDHSAAELLPTVEVPVLVIGGDRDPFTPASVQRRMHEMTPESELVIVPGAHHTLPLEEPRLVADTIDDFLDRRVVS
jgi:pimeloyl-ACP methyl ester carboxylesterase